MTIKLKAIKELGALVKLAKAGRKNNTITGNKIFVEIKEDRIRYLQTNGHFGAIVEYPNEDNIPTMTLSLDVPTLENNLKALDVHGFMEIKKQKNDKYAIRQPIVPPEDPIADDYRFLATEDQAPEIDRVTPREFNGNDGQFFDHNYVGKLISCLGVKDTAVKFEMATDLEPMRLTFNDVEGEPKVWALLMPMRKPR